MPIGFRAHVLTDDANKRPALGVDLGYYTRPPPQTVLAAPQRCNFTRVYTLPPIHVQHQIEWSCLLA